MRSTCLLLLFSLGGAVSAQASDINSKKPTVDLQLFRPAAGAHNLVTTETGEVNSHLGISLGLSFNYARNPLAVQIIQEDGTEKEIGAIVGYRLDANLLAAIGLLDVAEIGLAIPFIMQGGMDDSALSSAGVAVGAEDLKAFSQGDIRIIPKVQLVSAGEGLFAAAVLATVVVPSAGKTPYAGENNLVAAPALALSTRTKVIRAGLDLGYRWRDKTRIEPLPGMVLLTVDDEFFFNAGLAFNLSQTENHPFEIVGEVFGHTPADWAFGIGAKGNLAEKRQLARTSMEGDLGLRWAVLERLTVTLGGGAGLTPQGYGQPAPRVYLGAMYYTGEIGVPDADQDGIPDKLDQCVNKKEDKDGFQDTDGCPEPDNDGDKIPDDDDQCPNQPEDRDTYADEDGCPEADVDEDGVFDEKDKCPKDPEDQDKFEDEDGCPDQDNDGDALPDSGDACPNEAEDIDNFKDADGCPELDNDQDGLPDLGDLCPNNPEDKDGVADDDGCAEDNDGDGIPDETDKCPNEPEIYNGIEDEDGCPEQLKVKSLVQVTQEKIEIKEKVFFKTGSAKILPRSFGLLDQVAAVLKNYKHITKVRIEGHTDATGPRKRNLKLSAERAQSVRQYLLDKGVAAERLEAEGFGPDKPIGSNKTAAGKEMNRRVEFMIVEQKPIGRDVAAEQAPADSGIELSPEMTPAPPAEPGPAGDISIDLGEQPGAKALPQPPPAEATPAPPAEAAPAPPAEATPAPPAEATPAPPAEATPAPPAAEESAPGEAAPEKGKRSKAGKAKKAKAAKRKAKQSDDEIQFEF